MHSNLKSWTSVWIFLFIFIYVAHSLNESGGKIPYDVVLPPDGDGESLPPVVMLHALLDWRKTWKTIAPEIAKNTGRKVYAYDATNHGENKWSDEFGMNILASELDQFIKEQNISKAILVGHSMGGKTAMIFAVRKPEKVEKLIIEDISPRKPSPKVLRFLKQMFLGSKVGLTEFQHEADELSAKKVMARFLARIFTKKQAKDLGEDFLMDWMPITKRDEQFDWLSNLDLFIKMGNTQTPEDWDVDLEGEFQGDVMFLYGTKSVFNVSTDELIPKHFPHASFVKFEEATHFLHFEFMKKFENVVSDFINKKSYA